MTTPLPPSSEGIGSLYSPPPSQPLASLRASPIANFASTPNDGYGIDDNDSSSAKSPSRAPMPASGRLLAVNSRYVAYAVKKGLVRVIDRKSATRALLRGHDAGSRLVDASFFGGGGGDGDGGGDLGGVSGLWDDLAEAHRSRRRRGVAAGSGTGPPSPSGGGASDVLATVGGVLDRASVLIWRLHSSGVNHSILGADKLMEIRLGGGRAMHGASVIAWSPFDPNSFLLLHRNVPGGENDDGGRHAGGGRTIATLVDTRRLRIQRDDVEGHALCEIGRDGGGGEEEEGAAHLVVDHPSGGGVIAASTSGANDVAWSGAGPASSYALTCHDDGFARLWGLSPSSSSSSSSDAAVPCVATLDVGDPYDDDEVRGTPSRRSRATRVLFLPRYADPASCAGGGEAVTPPFVVGTDMNRTVTLWSSFRRSGSGGGIVVVPPTRLRVFGLRRDGADPFSARDMLSLEICPAPYRPKSSPLVAPGEGGGEEEEEDVAPPSSFVLMAERNVGVLHALHLSTEWAEEAVAVAGFDYVTTLNVVHPVYSLCVAPPATPSADRSLGEERDVDLCCLQSKAVQMLTLAAGMCAPPEEVKGGTDRGNPAPGVTLLGPSAAESCGDDDEKDDDEDGDDEEGGHEEDKDYEVYDDEEEDVGEEEFEEEYEVEEDGLEYSTNDGSGNGNDRESDAAAPTTAARESDSFSNWLCSVAVPPPAPAVAAPVTAAPPKEALRPVASTPPGLGFPSVMPPTPFLLPDQILSFSGSESDPPVATRREAPPRSIPLVPPGTSASAAAASSSSAAAAAGKPSKKSNRKNGQDGVKKAQAFPSNQPVAPMKILLRQDPNQEPAAVMPPLPPTTAAPDSSATPVVSAGVSNVDLGAVEAAVQRAIASQMKSHETQLFSSLREAIASEVAFAISSSFKDADKATSQAVQRGIASGLSSGLGTSLEKNGKLGRMVETFARESAASAAKEAVGAVQPLIMNSLHQTMREVMIPAYEAATRQMFEQTSISLEQGLVQVSMNQANSSAPALLAMSTQMTKMSEAIQSLSAEVAQLRGAVDASGANQTNGNFRGVQEGTPQPLGIRDEIAALCQAQRYEDAFTKAVSASDGDLVLYACKMADCEAVFSRDVSVSQPIMICLLQQLGAVLVPAMDPEDIKTILKWLQEIAVTIDPSNINIQRHVGGVVQQLLANINIKMSNCDPVFRRPMQMLVQVIRGLL